MDFMEKSNKFVIPGQYWLILIRKQILLGNEKSKHKNNTRKMNCNKYHYGEKLQH